MKCENCNRPARLEEWYWTSHFTWRVLCADCLLDEFTARGLEPPDNSLRALNAQRKPKRMAIRPVSQRRKHHDTLKP